MAMTHERMHQNTLVDSIMEHNQESEYILHTQQTNKTTQTFTHLTIAKKLSRG